MSAIMRAQIVDICSNGLSLLDTEGVRWEVSTEEDLTQAQKDLWDRVTVVMTQDGKSPPQFNSQELATLYNIVHTYVNARRVERTGGLATGPTELEELLADKLELLAGIMPAITAEDIRASMGGRTVPNTVTDSLRG